jgi:phage terminase large subunit-like protein
MPQCPEGHAGGSLVEGCETIVSVEREVRIPDRVFNIEVRGNNNYFAGGVLVHNCEHLSAVSAGQIKRLLINVRPRSGKTSAVAVAWPVWTWTQKTDLEMPLKGPGVRFLCGSYGASKAQEDAVTARRLIASEWFQRLWGSHVRIAKDRDNAERYDTTVGGSRISTGIPESLGKGGMVKFLDDPHKTSEVESDTVRNQVVRNYREIWQTRSNDPTNSAEVMVMQRQAEDDLSGFWLENFADDVVHLCLPAWFESDRACRTFIDMAGKIYTQPPPGLDVEVFWEDPREDEGESFWPQRYPPKHRLIDESLGDFPMAGQIQQRPEPRGGGIIKRMWWQAWPPDDAIEQWLVEGQVSYPPWELQVAYLDTAFTKKETNDYCAMTRWGVFGNSAGTPCAMLCGAWQERHSFGELIEHVKKSVRLWKTDILIIENKAGGIWVRDELLTQLEAGELTIVLDTPVVDKVSRAHAVVPLFTGSLVYAPFMHDKGVWRVWAEMTISNIEKFPTGRHDDICLVAGTLIATKRGLVPIERVTTDDQVITPIGWQRVIASGMTGISPTIERCGLRGTINHPVYSLDDGFIHLDTVTGATRLGYLTLCGLIQTIRLNASSSTASRIGAWAEAGDTISPSQHQTLGGKVRRGFMSQFGSMPTAQRFRPVTKCIIETTTPLISALIIWSAYRKTNIVACLRTWTWRNSFSTLIASDHSRSLGTDQRTDGNGTESTWLSPLRKLGRNAMSHVWSVALRLLPMLPTPSFAALSVRNAIDHAEDIHLLASLPASTAGPGFSLRSVSAPSFAARNARPRLDGIATTSDTEPQKVYNLSIERAQCYYANGILVHNCDTVTGALGYLRRNDLIKLKQEAEEEERESRRFKGNQQTIAEEYGIA